MVPSGFVLFSSTDRTDTILADDLGPNPHEVVDYRYSGAALRIRLPWPVQFMARSIEPPRAVRYCEKTESG